MKKNVIAAVFVTIIAVVALTLPLSAQSEGSDVAMYRADEFGTDKIYDALPPEVVEKLPKGDIFSSEDFADNFSADYFFSLIADAVREALSPAARQLASVLSLVLTASLLSTLRTAVASEALSEIFRFASGLCIMLTLYNSAWGLFDTVSVYLTGLCETVNVMVPITIAIGTAGGNVTSSAVCATGMMLGLAFVENLAAKGLFPVLQLCFGLSAASGIGSGLKLSGITKTVRGVFTFVLALCAAVISAVMSFQTSIAAHADSLSMRAVKFAASNAVPVVGGIAGDAVGAVAGSLALVKSTVGYTGVIIIAVMTLPVTVTVLVSRLGIKIAETAADILGLEAEKSLLSEIVGLYGFLAAVCVIAGLMFVYALTLFAKCAVAAA